MELSLEKLEFVKELKEKRSARISEYAKKFNVDFIEGKTPWEVKCHIALALRDSKRAKC